MTTSSRPNSPSDRLGEIGVADTSRILPLIEEIRKRIPWTDSDWEVLFEGARAAPDPNLYFLNVSKLCDSLPADDLVQAFARRGNIRVLGALLGGSESLPGQIANRPEIFAFLFLEGGHGRPGVPASLLAEAEEAADRSGTEEEIKAALRRQKLREVARIAARDSGGPIRPQRQANFVPIRFRFRAKQTRSHSPRTASMPRKWNPRKPSTLLIHPKGGSAMCLRVR